jgi:hypothetical protein
MGQLKYPPLSQPLATPCLEEYIIFRLRKQRGRISFLLKITVKMPHA